MLQSIYSAFNFVYWSFSALLWLIMWLFIIVAIITFIGFINVQFFTKNNAAFSKILKEEQNSSLRFLSESNKKQNSSSSSSDSDQCLDDIDSISNHSSRSRRNRRHRQRKPQKELPEEMEPKWTMSKRMKTRERARYQEMEESHDRDSSSPSESVHSISRSVSNSQTLSSNIKSLLKKDLNPPLFDADDISEPSKTAASGSNHTSPDMSDFSKFNFKLTERMKSKRKRNKTNNDSPTTDSTQSNEDTHPPHYWSEQRGNRHSQEAINTNDTSLKAEESENITPCDDNDNDIQFNVESMTTFDDVYNFMDNLVHNKHKYKANEDIRSQIQSCIDGGTLKLKSFEKALLISKLMEL